LHTETTLYGAGSSRISGWDMRDDALRKTLGVRVKTLCMDKRWSQKELAANHSQECHCETVLA
jgi:hypothetical protein